MIPRTLILICFLLCSTSLKGQNQEQEHSRSKTLALALSLTSTLAPIGRGLALAVNHNSSGYFLVAAGVVLGPATGLSYSGNSQRAQFGVGRRTFYTACATFALALRDKTDEESETAFVDEVVGTYVLVALVDIISDIAVAARSVDEFNHGRGFSDLRITPTYLACHKAPGMMLILSF